MGRKLDLQQSLIEKLKKGDEHAAYTIYEMYSKAMYNTLVRITGSSDDAADLLQEAFIKVFKKIDQFSGKSTLGAWIKKVVVNTGLEFIRKRKLQFEEIDETMDKEEEFDDSINPVHVHEAIKKLPSGSRTILSLFALEGYSHKEIAEELGITESTSKTQYLRGKKLLKEHLKDIYHE